jgi:predicted DNA-binding transcriptional regulator AlpA
MTKNETFRRDVYLDAYELAETLQLSVSVVLSRAKRRPWLLPPRATLYDRELLRWRQDVVEAWLTSSKI